MTKKLSAAARIQAAASTWGPADRDLLRRWIYDSTSRIEIDGKSIQLSTYLANADLFSDMEDTDPTTEVTKYFSTHRSEITAAFAASDSEKAERERLEAEVRQQELKRQEAVRELAIRQQEAVRRAREHEQQEMLTSQATARREAAEAEERAWAAATASVPTEHPAAIGNSVCAPPVHSPKDGEILDFEDSRPTTRRERNLDTLLLGVSGLLGYADTDDLRRGDPALHNTVRKTCSDYRWGKHVLVDLDWQAANVRDPSRAIFGKVIYPNLDSTRKARADSRSARTTDFIPEGIEPNAPNLCLPVHGFLKANAPRDYTYNQIADEIGAGWKEVSRECQRLVRDQDSGVVRAARRTTKGTSEVFRYAPDRKRIETGSATSDAVIKQVLLRLIGECPAQSLRQLAEMTRRELMSMADHSFRAALADLIASGSVVVKLGLRRANLHFLAS
ncbi:MAG: hypothetical protein H7145_14625 [Akkermansiaceae bacterium]|nr:hypothetical protein [Armatimonadota bacterium]